MTGTDFHFVAARQLGASSSRKFDKSVLGMTSQNESNKKTEQSVQRWATAAPPVGGRKARKAANARKLSFTAQDLQ